MEVVEIVKKNCTLKYFTGTGCGAVVWGTALQNGSSRFRIPMLSIDNPFGRTMAFGSTQRLTDMGTRNNSCGLKATSSQGWQPYCFHVLTVSKSGILNLLGSSGDVNIQCGPKVLGLIFLKNRRHIKKTHELFIQNKLHWHIYRLLLSRTLSEKLPKIPLFGLL
jgi:hypothetical protein